MDYYALEQAAFQADESCHLTSSATLQSKKEAIVGEATEKTKAALAGAGYLSKRSRRAGIRQNRAAEKEHERQNNKWLLGESSASDKTSGATGELTEKAEQPEYVPASSKLDRIDQLIDEMWSDDGQEN
jgi:hypothetical protein